MGYANCANALAVDHVTSTKQGDQITPNTSVFMILIEVGACHQSPIVQKKNTDLETLGPLWCHIDKTVFAWVIWVL